MKILFLLKKAFSYGYGGVKSGLSESANLTSAELTRVFDVECKVSLCVDGDSIDKELFDYKPDICIIEALWVTPDKLREVQRLHPSVKFYVRSHSEIPFLATEGIAIDWIKEYVSIPNVYNAFNSFTTCNDFKQLLHHNTEYLPNIFTKIIPKNISLSKHLSNFFRNKITRRHIHIGCFGAIRPMKNQLIQAIAAIRYGDDNDKIIHFHINGGRIEQGGDCAIKNIRAAFKGTKHKLIEHGWLPRIGFLFLIKNMDIGLQMSYSESFNIVAADFAFMEVPIIVSEAIRWMPNGIKADIDVTEIAAKIKYVLRFKEYFIQSECQALSDYNDRSLHAWKRFIYGN